MIPNIPNLRFTQQGFKVTIYLGVLGQKKINTRKFINPKVANTSEIVDFNILKSVHSGCIFILYANAKIRNYFQSGEN